jgi:hypothetical protein
MTPEFRGKTVLSLVEEVELRGDGLAKKVLAKIDTGATSSSIDTRLASELRLGPVIESKLVKSAHGTKLRPVVEADLTIKGRHLKAKFTIADRSHLRYHVLIGINILKQGFVIVPE